MIYGNIKNTEEYKFLNTDLQNVILDAMNQGKGL